MEYLEYYFKVTTTIHQKYPDKEKRTVRNYLDTFTALIPSVQDTARKSKAKAEEHFAKGISLWANDNYEDAIKMYTQSLRKAPPYSECAAEAYAQRSAMLYSLKSFDECILDMDRALDLPLSDEMRSSFDSQKKLVSAMHAMALFNANSFVESVPAIDKALELLCPTDEEYQDLKNMRKGAVFINSVIGPDQTKKNVPVEDTIVHGKSSQLRGASRGIDIAYSPKDGRTLVAKMSFRAGDILAVQDPLLTVIDVEEPPTHCHQCLKKSRCLIPCDQCQYAVYCSENCRTEAYEKYHRIECKIESLLIGPFPFDVWALLCQLRCLNILTDQGNDLKGLRDDIREIEENSDPLHLGFTGKQFIGNTRKAFLSLMLGKEMKPTPVTMFEATCIVTLLRNHTNFFKSNSDVPIVAELLIKLNNIYASNCTTIPLLGSDTKARRMYPFMKLANHACVSNTISYIDNDGRMILRASQNIRPGDQILCGYRVHYDFEDTTVKSNRVLQCKRVCSECDKTYSYPPGKPQRVKMDARLRAVLQKEPHEIDALWKLLNLVHGIHQRYTLQAQIVKMMLVDAYEGGCDREDGRTQLELIGIL